MTAVGAAGVLALAAVGMWIAVMAIAQWRDLPPAHHRAEDAAIEWHARRLIARLEDDLRAAAAADAAMAGTTFELIEKRWAEARERSGLLILPESIDTRLRTDAAYEAVRAWEAIEDRWQQ